MLLSSALPLRGSDLCARRTSVDSKVRGPSRSYGGLPFPSGRRIMKDAIRGRSPWQLAFERLSRDRWATASAACIAFIILVAILAPLIAAAVQHSPESQFRETGLSPS